MPNPQAVTLVREMGLTHAEFFRSLPAALAGSTFQISATTVSVSQVGGRSLEIMLGPQQERRIAALVLPLTQVTFKFVDFTQDEINVFMENFQRHFQRGGG